MSVGLRIYKANGDISFDSSDRLPKFETTFTGGESSIPNSYTRVTKTTTGPAGGWVTWWGYHSVIPYQKITSGNLNEWALAIRVYTPSTELTGHHFFTNIIPGGIEWSICTQSTSYSFTIDLFRY
jgi:hypothetical protein